MFTIANVRPIGHNVGNHAINFCLRQLIYEVFGRYVSIIDYPASSRYESSSNGGLSPKSIHDFNRYVDGVIIGGGNLFENNEIDVAVNSLPALQPPLMLFSNSRGRIYNKFGRLSERTDVITDAKLSALVNHSDISLSRDSVTTSYIKQLGLSDELGYCPTINSKYYRHLLPKLPDNENVGALISVRTPSLMNLPFKLQSNLPTDIGFIIDSLRSHGYQRVRILCNDSRDLDFASSFRYSHNVDSFYTNDVYQYLSLLSSASLVVSYRLHATLPCISFGTPCVNVVYDERALTLFQDLNLKPPTDFVNLVESGPDYIHQIFQMIQSGGVTPERSTELNVSWQPFESFQRKQLTIFKQLMETYVGTK